MYIYNNGEVFVQQWNDVQYIYTNEYIYIEEFVCLNALLLGAMVQIISVVDSLFIEESYRLYIITLRPIAAEH